MLFWHRLVLVLHVIGVLMLFSAVTLHILSATMLRQADTLDRVRMAGGISRKLPMLFRIATAVIVVTGIILAVRVGTHGEPYGWIIVAFVSLTLFAAWGSIFGRRTGRRIGQLAREAQGQMTQDLTRAIQHPAILADAIIGLCATLGIVVLMIYRPDVLASVAVMIVACLIGAAISAWLSRAPRKIQSDARETPLRP